ncbi:MAG: GlmU family protein [Bacteroidota bacterium]
MNFVLFDDTSRGHLLPLTFTRPVCEIRAGITTIREKWESWLKSKVSYITQDYLSVKFPLVTGQENICINGSVIPDDGLLRKIAGLKPGQAIIKGDIPVAFYAGEEDIRGFNLDFKGFDTLEYSAEFLKISRLWDIFLLNGELIRRDFAEITEGRKSASLSSSNTIIAAENIFAEEDAVIEAATLNGKAGPVYIGKGAEIMEGAVVRGPFAICDHSILKLSAKIYGPTTIGPHSRVGGEVNNSVFQGYSNKAHDGFLGQAVIGEWCNIGADSNNSNLKNNYAEVRLWDYTEEKFVNTGQLFCGLIMGDHSKCGINTMFNTGTVVGVSANIFGSGFPRNFIPDFSWGGAHGFTTFTLPKAFEVAEKIMERRQVDFDSREKDILTKVYQLTEKHRKF